MNVYRGFLLYLIMLGAFFAIDMTWLGVVARGFYRNQLGPLMADSVNWLAAIIFYLLFIVGVLLFVVNPALDEGSLWRAVGMGILFGVITYSTYDLTNLSTLQGWPLKMTIVDIIWGGVLSASISVVGYLVYNALWG
ncbi:DUF2177 family protein [Candidatus Bipolaricaulota bacterium]|nr:DUF2177 family protein [Candidatus Bipolaricaulota bacterium]